MASRRDLGHRKSSPFFQSISFPKESNLAEVTKKAHSGGRNTSELRLGRIQPGSRARGTRPKLNPSVVPAPLRIPSRLRGFAAGLRAVSEAPFVDRGQGQAHTEHGSLAATRAARLRHAHVAHDAATPQRRWPSAESSCHGFSLSAAGEEDEGHCAARGEEKVLLLL